MQTCSCATFWGTNSFFARSKNEICLAQSIAPGRLHVGTHSAILFVVTTLAVRLSHAWRVVLPDSVPCFCSLVPPLVDVAVVRQRSVRAAADSETIVVGPSSKQLFKNFRLTS